MLLVLLDSIAHYLELQNSGKAANAQNVEGTVSSVKREARGTSLSCQGSFTWARLAEHPATPPDKGTSTLHQQHRGQPQLFALIVKSLC